MSIYDELANSILAKDLTQNDLHDLAEIAREQHFYKDELVFSENEEGDKFYLLMEGKVCIERRIMSTIIPVPKLIVTVKKGQIFGEMAFVEKTVRSATARCKSNVRVLFFVYNDLKQLFSRNPELANKLLTNMAGILSKRLRRMNDQWLNTHARFPTT
ncbi:MAG TPA: cyclic nucleotide-binding domain-containing protein [bacterium]|mgnify:CR=1 FL=1|nr:cyclic nucleotide-binding domain-containing protein [bacterium]HPN45319.1 cyclic nucleotide-binding domain-containing protein [bacterium]